jgi:hypothetical protein
VKSLHTRDLLLKDHARTPIEGERVHSFPEVMCSSFPRRVQIFHWHACNSFPWHVKTLHTSDFSRGFSERFISEVLQVSGRATGEERAG